MMVGQKQRLCTQCACFGQMKSASDSLWWSHWPCWNCIVSPRLHSVISAYSQYLRMDAEHYIPPDCQPGLMPQIASVRYRMAELGYNAALSPKLTPTTTLFFLQVIQCTGKVIKHSGCDALRDALRKKVSFKETFQLIHYSVLMTQVTTRQKKKQKSNM